LRWPASETWFRRASAVVTRVSPGHVRVGEYCWTADRRIDYRPPRRRWIFYVNSPVGAVALFVVGISLNLPFQRRQHAIDYLGAALLATTVTCLLLALVWGGNVYAWTSPIIVSLALAVITIGTAFVLRERRAPEPVLPLTLFRNPVLVVSRATLFFSTCAFFAAVVFLPLYVQVVRGATGTDSRLLLLPMMLGNTLSATASGSIISWTGRYKWFPALGLAPMALALWLFAQMGPSTD
jgi:Na+/melibiose symporter-like transporter